MSFEEAIEKAFPVEKIKGLKNKGQSVEFKIDVHPANVFKADMTASTNLTYGTFANSVVEPIRVPGVAKAPDRQVAVLDICAIGQLAPNQPRLTWVERSARTEGAAARNEGAIMGNSDFTYISRSTDVQNISTYVKTTNESLEYWDQLLSEIRMELVPMIQRKLDDYLLTGTGSAPQLLGLCYGGTIAQAYSYTGLSNMVEDPNYADALVAGLTQIKVALHRPNYILLHPTDVAIMRLSKDANGNSPRSVTYNMEGAPFIDGVPVKENTGITAGKVLIGDFTKASVWFRKGIDIRIWDQNDTDPIYNYKTITADMACAFKVPTVDYNAFLYDDISDIITAIAK
jgi:HK97 family phage major capsid protein